LHIKKNAIILTQNNKEMKNLKNILLYILIVILFTIFTVGIGGGFSSPESNLAAYICGSFWGIIWLPVLTSRDN